MARITVLDPTAAPPEVDPDPGPDAGELAGRIVGIRSDRTWPSFEWVLDEWTRELTAARAQVRPWRAGNRIGDDGVRTFADQVAFGAFHESYHVGQMGYVRRQLGHSAVVG